MLREKGWLVGWFGCSSKHRTTTWRTWLQFFRELVGNVYLNFKQVLFRDGNQTVRIEPPDSQIINQIQGQCEHGEGYRDIAQDGKYDLLEHSFLAQNWSTFSSILLSIFPWLLRSTPVPLPFCFLRCHVPCENKRMMPR